MKKILIVVMSKNCGHCVKLKKMKNEIVNNFDGDVVFYDFNNLEDAPSFIKKYTKWVPNMFLISNDKWILAKKGSKIKTKDFKVINGYIVNNELKHKNKYNIYDPSTYKKF